MWVDSRCHRYGAGRSRALLVARARHAGGRAQDDVSNPDIQSYRTFALWCNAANGSALGQTQCNFAPCRGFFASPTATLAPAAERVAYCGALSAERAWPLPAAVLAIRWPPGHCRRLRRDSFARPRSTLGSVQILSGDRPFRIGWPKRCHRHPARPRRPGAQRHEGGRFLYATNCGDANEIVIYSVDADHGRLSLVGRQSSLGSTPREFRIDPSGRWLIVGNPLGDTAYLFARDTQTGLLKPVPSGWKWARRHFLHSFRLTSQARRRGRVPSRERRRASRGARHGCDGSVRGRRREHFTAAIDSH
ncbi:lactonase family protein [Mycetohabitans sp. B8]|nr:lactonase family protein [Mycetohabitans sp. B8]